MPNLVTGLNISGVDAKGEWTTSSNYYEGDIVTRGGSAYECLVNHLSNNFETDFSNSKWQILVRGVRWRGDYAADTLYLKDDLVYENYNTYVANATFTSNSVSFSNDTNWELYARGGFNTVADQASSNGKILTTDGTDTSWTSNVDLDAVTVNTITANGLASFPGGLSSNNGVTLSGTVSIQELQETVVLTTLASNVATLNWTDGNIFYVQTGSNTASVDVNVINIPTTDNKVQTVNLFLNQEATASNIGTFQINNSNVSVLWLGGAQLTPTSNSLDVYNFTLMRVSNTWNVFGSITRNFS